MQLHKKANIYLGKDRQTNFLTLSAIFNRWGQNFVKVTADVIANQGANFGKSASERTAFHPLYTRRTGVVNRGRIFDRTLSGFAKIANTFLKEKEPLNNKLQAELFASACQLSQKQQLFVRSDRASPPKKMDLCGYG